MIEVPFTFFITEKKKTYSRVECGIPEDKFVLAMVGNRYVVRNNTMSTDICGDVVGMIELSDLYVNPKRLGGGFSVIEAFHAGIPVVSIKYGDVATAAEEEFCVEDYNTMVNVINKYKSDKSFYIEMVNKGKERENYIINGYELFGDRINKILKSDN